MKSTVISIGTVYLHQLLLLLILAALLVRGGHEQESNTSSNCTSPDVLSLKKEGFLKKLKEQCKSHKASSFFCNNLQLLVTLTTEKSSLCGDGLVHPVHEDIFLKDVHDNGLYMEDNIEDANEQYKLPISEPSEWDSNKRDRKSTHEDNIEGQLPWNTQLIDNGARKKLQGQLEEDIEGGGDGGLEDYEKRKSYEKEDKLPNLNDEYNIESKGDLGDYRSKFKVNRTSVIDAISEETNQDLRNGILFNDSNIILHGVDTVYNNAKEILDDFVSELKQCLYGNIFHSEVNDSKGRQTKDIHKHFRGAINWLTQTFLNSKETPNTGRSKGYNESLNSIVKHWLIAKVKGNDTVRFDQIRNSLGRKLDTWHHNIDLTMIWMRDKGREYLKPLSGFICNDSTGRQLDRWYNTMNDVVYFVVTKTLNYFKNIGQSGLNGLQNIGGRYLSGSNSSEGFIQMARQFVRSQLPNNMSVRSMIDTARHFTNWAGLTEAETGRGKKIKLMALWLMMKGGMAMSAAIAGVKVLAFKALLVSVVSLTLASIVAFKKLAGGGGGGGGGSGGSAVIVEQGGGGVHKGPWQSASTKGPWSSFKAPAWFGLGSGGHKGWDSSFKSGGGGWDSGGGGWDSSGKGGGWDSSGKGGGWDSSGKGGGSGKGSGWESSGSGWDSGGGEGKGGGGWSSGGGSGKGGGSWDSGGGGGKGSGGKGSGGWDGGKGVSGDGGGGKGYGGWNAGGKGGWSSGGPGGGWSSGGGGGWSRFGDSGGKGDRIGNGNKVYSIPELLDSSYSNLKSKSNKTTTTAAPVDSSDPRTI